MFVFLADCGAYRLAELGLIYAGFFVNGMDPSLLSSGNLVVVFSAAAAPGFLVCSIDGVWRSS